MHLLDLLLSSITKTLGNSGAYGESLDDLSAIGKRYVYGLMNTGRIVFLFFFPLNAPACYPLCLCTHRHLEVFRGRGVYMQRKKNTASASRSSSMSTEKSSLKCVNFI